MKAVARSLLGLAMVGMTGMASAGTVILGQPQFSPAAVVEGEASQLGLPWDFINADNMVLSAVSVLLGGSAVEGVDYQVGCSALEPVIEGAYAFNLNGGTSCAVQTLADQEHDNGETVQLTQVELVGRYLYEPLTAQGVSAVFCPLGTSLWYLGTSQPVLPGMYELTQTGQQVPGVYTCYEDFVNALDVGNTQLEIADLNAPPVIQEMVANPNPALAGRQVDFTLVASDPDGDPLTFDWNFGDGSSEAGVTQDSAQHTFSNAGSYNVSVVARDDQGGASAPFEVTVVVLPNNPPIVDSITPSASTAEPGVPIQFSVAATDPEGEALTYDWDFGDGTTQTGVTQASVEHSFSQPGSYIVSVIARDAGGNASVPVQVTIEVATVNTPPTIDSVTPSASNVLIGQQVDFTVAATDADGDPLTFDWDFGDGSTLTGVNGSSVQHSYGQAGNFNVTVIAHDDRDGSSAPASVAVTVTEPAWSLGVPAGDSQLVQAVVGQAATVRVSVKLGGVAAPGETVQWSTSDPAAAVNPASSDSNSDGRAATSVTVSQPGRYVLTASAHGLQLDFLVLASLDANTVAKTPLEASISAVMNACPDAADNTPEFQATCNAIVGAGNGDQQQAFNDLQNDEIDNQRMVMDSLSSQQGANLRARLAALRAGARGVSLGGFALNLNGLNLPGNLLLASLNDVGQETADEPLLNDRLGVFVTGTLSYGDKDKTDSADGFEFDTVGITVGADYRFTDQFVAGAALGLASTNVDLDTRGGSIDSDGYTLELFGTYYPSDSFYLEGYLGYGQSNLDQERNIDFLINGNQFRSSFLASPDGDQLFAALGGGWEYDATNGAQLSLFGRFEYLDGSIDGYSERESGGATGMAVAVNSQDIESLTSNLGAQLRMGFSMGWGVLMPHLRAEWIHEFKDDRPIISAFYLGNLDPNRGNMRFYGEEIDQDYARLGLGLTAYFKQGLSGFVSYDSILSKQNYSQHDWNLGLRYEVKF